METVIWVLISWVFTALAYYLMFNHKNRLIKKLREDRNKVHDLLDKQVKLAQEYNKSAIASYELAIVSNQILQMYEVCFGHLLSRVKDKQLVDYIIETIRQADEITKKQQLKQKLQLNTIYENKDVKDDQKSIL